MGRPARPLRILQVGCGPTGTAVLREVLPRLAAADVPVVYEVADGAVMGPGLAFSTPYDLHLLNVRADRMSLCPREDGEFARWRDGHSAQWRALFADPSVGWADYPPRRLFGEYARWVLDEALTGAADAGQEVVLTREPVVAVRRDTDRGWRCRFMSGRTATYDRVVLALGHLPSARYGPADGGPGFLRDPWGGLEFPDGARVGVIGTRLTGVDVALALRERGHAGPVLLASRSGWLPSVKGRTEPYRLTHVPAFVERRLGRPGSVALAELAAVIGREIEQAEGRTIRWAEVLWPPPTSAATLRDELVAAHSGQPIGWQSVLAAVVPWVPALWRLLTEAGRQQLMTRYVGMWAVRIASFPAVSAGRMVQMLEEERLTVRAGLTAVEPAGSGYRMHFADGRIRVVDVVVNATGPGYGRDSLDAAELTSDLVRTGTAVPHRWGGIEIDEDTFEARGARGATAPGLYVVGDLTRGVWLATNAVQNSVSQAARLAEVLARDRR